MYQDPCYGITHIFVLVVFEICFMKNQNDISECLELHSLDCFDFQEQAIHILLLLRRMSFLPSFLANSVIPEENLLSNHLFSEAFLSPFSVFLQHFTSASINTQHISLKLVTQTEFLQQTLNLKVPSAYTLYSFIHLFTH